MKLIDVALKCELQAPEKLLLVYLASQANAVGVGMWRSEEQIENDLRYSERSLQRLRKSLRDTGVLREVGAWYVLQFNFFPGVSDEDLAELQGIQLTLSTKQNDPPPDTVRESEIFKKLIAGGFDDADAYDMAQLKLSQSNAVVTLHSRTPALAAVPKEEVFIKLPDPELTVFGDDHQLGTVLTYLLPDWPTPNVIAAVRPLWQAIIDFENKNSVAGEVSAFDLIYPAILKAAEIYKGQMTPAQFLSLEKVYKLQAPWDVIAAGSTASRMSDSQLQREISDMLREIEATGNANCQVQPQTKEVGDDGVTRMESIASFHARVKAKYNQMLQLKSMGAI